MASLVGSAVKRLEDPALLTGRGRFVDDIAVPSMLHLAFVRSSFAHARIRGIDAADARALPGVHAVYSFADLPGTAGREPMPLPVPNAAIKHPKAQHVLVRDEAVYVGDPIAMVLADSRYVAEDAVALVEVDYVPLPAASDGRAALAPGAPRAHADLPDNVIADIQVGYGDVDAAFAAAAHVVDGRFFQHRGGAQPMECRAVLAVPDTLSDTLTLWANTQMPHILRDAVAGMLDLANERVRVVAPDVGGGFGPKGPPYPEQIAVAAAARLIGRPVKWVEDRREHFVAMYQERDQWWEAALALDAEGRILGLRGRFIHDGGAHLPWGIVTPYISATTVPGPYVVPAYRMGMTAVYTNKVSTTPVRGAGRPQAVFAMERLMDRAAQALGLDPAELRSRNFVRPDQMPYAPGLTFRDGSPVTYDSGDYPACQDMTLARADYAGFPARQAAALAAGRYIGIATASYVEGTGLGPFEGVTVRVGTDGRAVVETAAAPQGQGHRTMFAQLVAQELGLPLESIDVVLADTKAMPRGIGTFASRITANAGSSALIAARGVADKLRKVAAHVLEAAEQDIDLVDGRAFVKGVPEMGRSFRELARIANGMPGFALPRGLPVGLDETAHFTPTQAVYANGCHVAEVEVDVETGQVHILRYTTGHDCGTVLNPLIVEGQVTGGVAHGVGNALFEWMKYDENAQPVTANFGEYLLPSAPEVPSVAQVHMESPTPMNPLGVKGAGEGGTIPAPAVIAGAIENALAPFGVRIDDVPVTPERIVELLRATKTEV